MLTYVSGRSQRGGSTVAPEPPHRREDNRHDDPPSAHSCTRSHPTTRSTRPISAWSTTLGRCIGAGAQGPRVWRRLSAGLFVIAGCTPGGSATRRRARATAAAPPRRQRRRDVRAARSIPGGDRRALPRRRLERPRRADPERRRAQRHPLELRLVDDGRRGRPADDQADHPRRGERLRAAGRRGRVRLALRPRRAATRCTREGVTDENYLRGVQEADDDGIVTFKTIFPACYSGPLAAHPLRGLPEPRRGDRRAATRSRPRRSRCPKDACDAVYATDGYEQSVHEPRAGLARRRDKVFGDDGGVHQLGTISGSVADGLAVALVVPVGT